MVVCSVIGYCHSSVFENIFYFTYGNNRFSFGFKQVEDCFGSRSQREIFSAFRSCIVAVTVSDKRSCDYSCYGIVAYKNFPCCLAHFIKLINRDNVLMACYLEYRVGRRIYNRIACFNMLVSQLVYYGSTGGGNVTKRLSSDSFFKFIHNFFRKSCFRKSRKWIFRNDTGDFPMSCSCILSVGSL